MSVSSCQVSADSPSTAAAIWATSSTARDAGGVSGRDFAGPFARFERFEICLADREDQLLAQAEVSRAQGEWEAELTNLEISARVEAEMAALKQARAAAGPAGLGP